MSGGPSVEYLWPVVKPGSKKEVPTALPAPEYIGNLSDWCYDILNDPTVFVKDDEPYPKTFIKTCKKILQRLFRVFAHIYHSHMTQVEELGMEAHLNTALKHFVYFVREFNLVPSSELEPLRSVINQLCGSSR